MTKFNNYTSVFRVRLGDDDDTEDGSGGRSQGRSGPRMQVKSRPVVSCLTCRSRKQKCDRLQPCGTCTRRGDGAQCRYGADGGQGVQKTSAREGKGSGAPTPQERHEAQARLQKLEAMVSQMATTGDGGAMPTERSGQRLHHPPLDGARPPAQAPLAFGDPDPAGTESGTRDGRYEWNMPIGVGEDGRSGRVAKMIGETPFVGTTNWAAVLDSIRDIQTYLGGVAGEGEGEHEHEVEDETEDGLLATTEGDGIFAAVVSSGLDENTSAAARQPRMARLVAEAVRGLPSRQTCDRLLAVYFQSGYMTAPFVHMGQFQRAYGRFWQTGNPASAHAASPVLWVSVLASILTIGAMMSGGVKLAWETETETEVGRTRTNADLDLGVRLRRLSTRCLVAGEYMSGRPLAIEALLLSAQVRLMQKREHDAALWATFGVAVRLAQRMGYQQVDGPGRRRLSAYEAEMRRRVWYFVESFDMLYSVLFGMPTMVHEDETATDAPRNLRDDDFDEDTVDLPAARLSSDPTPALYFGVKLGLVRLLRRVQRVSVWSRRGSAAEHLERVLELADALQEAHAAVPARLQMPQRIRDCPFSDASHDIMHRLVLELIVHKSVCILFRESLCASASANAPPAEARAMRQACLVSAMRVLDLHTDFEHETRPASASASVSVSASAGRLSADRHVINTLAVHDFLLAATIVCLDLIEGDQSTGADPGADPGLARRYGPCMDDVDASLAARAADRGAKMDALRRAYALWHEQRLASRDAAHAARVLGAIVTKLAADAHVAEHDWSVRDELTVYQDDTLYEQPMTEPPPAHLNYAYDWADPGPFGAVLNDPANIDWNMVDAFLLDRQMDLDVGSNVWSADLMALEM